VIINKKKKIVIASGYFNPLHKGHIEYLNKSKSLGEFLYVIVNSDYQRNLKGSKEFQSENERLLIIENLKCVDFALIAIDNDRTVKESIKKIFIENNKTYDFVFTNGGDQFFTNSPETKICKELNIETVDCLGDKIQSSSYLLRK
tara:strand:- start:307 stop:741 length:435 start_codon:yes stop_codon:yes gene_type:complete